MATTKWAADPAHSEVNFRIKHLMITNVSGSFQQFDVQAETDGDDFDNPNITFTAEAASITTGSEQRDNHLRSDDFFNAEQYPQLKFTATKMEKTGDGEYSLFGDLTIRDKTNPVRLNVEYGGLARDPWGNVKAGFTITGKINRKDWGLNWNAALEAGGVMVSDEVRIQCEIQMVKQMAAATV